MQNLTTSRTITRIHVFFIRKSLFCLSLNFLNISRNWAWDFLKFFLTFIEINWLEWLTLSLLILYTWIWISSLTFCMQQRRNTDFSPIKTLNFGNWASWFSYDFLKILTIWASFSYKPFSYKKKACTQNFLSLDDAWALHTFNLLLDFSYFECLYSSRLDSWVSIMWFLWIDTVFCLSVKHLV